MSKFEQPPAPNPGELSYDEWQQGYRLTLEMVEGHQALTEDAGLNGSQPPADLPFDGAEVLKRSRLDHPEHFARYVELNTEFSSTNK